MRKKLAAAALVASFGVAAAAPSSASAWQWWNEEPSGITLAEVLLSDSAHDDADGFDYNWWDYDIVTQAVLLFPDLTEAALNPDAELTTFLPQDRAFRKLVKEITGERLHTEADVFAAVASLGVDTVKAVLQYHIVPAKISYDDAFAADGATVPTLLEGATLEVDVRGRWHHKLFIKDADTDDRDPKVVDPNIGGENLNGFAHGINRVLRPIDLP